MISRRFTIILTIILTFCNFLSEYGIFPTHEYEQFGHECDACWYRNIMVFKIDANGVTPIPHDIKTACSASEKSVDGVPYGPFR